MSVMSALAKAAAKAAGKAASKGVKTVKKYPKTAKTAAVVGGVAGYEKFDSERRKTSLKDAQTRFDQELKDKKRIWEAEGYSAAEQMQMTKELRNRILGGK